VDSLKFPGDDSEGASLHSEDASLHSEDASLHDHEANSEDTLNNIGCVNEPTDDDWDILDPESPTGLSLRHPISPPSSPRVPPAVIWPTKGSVRKVWSKSKKLFMEKFGRKQTTPKLSDKLVPERDEVKWYEALFSKPQKSAATRKPSHPAADT
jgi:hypothetical protein